MTLTSGDSGLTEDTEEPGLVLVLDSTNNQPGLGGFGGFTGRFPGLGQSFGQNLGPNFGQVFPGFGRFPSRLPPSFGFEDSRPEISLDLGDIFGSRPSGSDRRVPSIISALFDVLGDSLGVEGSQGGQGGLEGGQEAGEYDHHNSTYDERVLADGSVVRVNRTTIQDTDDSGNTFYFSTSVHHVLDGGDWVGTVEDVEGESSEEAQDSEEDEESEDGEGSEVAEGEDEGIAMVEEVGSEETSGEESGETFVSGPEEIPEYEPEAEIVPTDIDETENEVSNDKDREGKAEFPGTDSNAFIDDSLFE